MLQSRCAVFNADMHIRGCFFPSRTFVGVSTCAPRNTVRHASINSAIERGIRKSQSQRLGKPSYSKGGDRNSASAGYGEPRGRYSAKREPVNWALSGVDQRHRLRSVEREDRKDNWKYHKKDAVVFDEDEFIKTGNFSRRGQASAGNNHHRPGSSSAPPRTGNRDGTFDREDYRDRRRALDSGYPPRHASSTPIASRPPGNRRKKRGEHMHRITDETPERVKANVAVPASIPYTTPASEFIYGANAVEAALRCSRRKLYKLYIYQAAGTELSESKITLRKLALANNVPVKMAFGDWERLMDKMSAGRPHNGCILEASPLPLLPVKHFKPVASLDEDHFHVVLGAQSREEAAVNGVDNRIPILRTAFRPSSVTSASPSASSHDPEATRDRKFTKRYPVVLMLDGILDPGNLGAIIRSAYYLGIDAVAFAGRNSAPVSPVTIKASGGAAENMTMLDVSNEVAFIQESRANGWKFYAADAPGPDASYVDTAVSVNANAATDTEPAAGSSILTQSPSVLMMGSEGSGLASHIRAHADAIVSIPGARIGADLGVVSDPARVDSLNVSVAAALLMQMFLRVPLAVNMVVNKSRK